MTTNDITVTTNVIACAIKVIKANAIVKQYNKQVTLQQSTLKLITLPHIA